MDTKGEEQEIMNAYSNAKMFKRGTIVKIILFIEFHTLINSRGVALADLVNRQVSLFPKDPELFQNSMMILVTKVDTRVFKL